MSDMVDWVFNHCFRNRAYRERGLMFEKEGNPIKAGFILHLLSMSRREDLFCGK